MKAISRILIGSLLVLTLASCGDISLKGIVSQRVFYSSSALKILVIYAGWSPSTLVSNLSTYGDIKTVDSLDGTTTVPTLAQLRAYHVVYLASDNQPLAGVCDNLAAYLDGGGRIVLDVFDWDTGYSITGRLLTQYSPFQLGAGAGFIYDNLGAHDSGHPVMAGVNTFSASYWNHPSLSPGASQIASWLTSGYPLVAEMGNVVALNAGVGFPLSDWPGAGWTGDGWTLLHNAIVYIAHK